MAGAGCQVHGHGRCVHRLRDAIGASFGCWAAGQAVGTVGLAHLPRSVFDACCLSMCPIPGLYPEHGCCFAWLLHLHGCILFLPPPPWLVLPTLVACAHLCLRVINNPPSCLWAPGVIQAQSSERSCAGCCCCCLGFSCCCCCCCPACPLLGVSTEHTLDACCVPAQMPCLLREVHDDVVSMPAAAGWHCLDGSA
jgi:hypothetical protein